jgi:catechol 2,3-dioxygenase
MTLNRLQAHDMTLPAETHISRVHLQVSDLLRSLGFYSEVLGLRLLSADDRRARLSASGTPTHLIELEAVPNATARPPRTSGLYHVAFRVPNRRELARIFFRLVTLGRRFQGFADHRVSEALYLADDDGIGLEIYRDRPRDTWPLVGQQVQMTSDPLDVNALLREGEHDQSDWRGIDQGTDIGHIHLNVGSLERARAFYVDLLGMDVMQSSFPGALFIAAGGYHHHLGLNMWAGANVPPPPPTAVGLRRFSIGIPTHQGWSEAVDRFVSAGVKVHISTIDGVPTAALRDHAGLEVELIQTA